MESVKHDLYYPSLTMFIFEGISRWEDWEVEYCGIVFPQDLCLVSLLPCSTKIFVLFGFKWSSPSKNGSFYMVHSNRDIIDKGGP